LMTRLSNEIPFYLQYDRTPLRLAVCSGRRAEKFTKLQHGGLSGREVISLQNEGSL